MVVMLECRLCQSWNRLEETKQEGQHGWEPVLAKSGDTWAAASPLALRFEG